MATGQSKKRNKSKKNQDTPKMPKERGKGRFSSPRDKAGAKVAFTVTGPETFGTQVKGSYSAHGAPMSPSTKSRVKEKPRAADTKGITKIGKY